MKNLSREAIKRMTGAQGSTTTIGGSGGGDMAGYATQLWTDENYVGKDFFRSLFKAYDANGNEVLPNDTTTTIDNIKAMFGFWTDFWLSALGKGNQTTVGLRLSQLADVNVAGVQNDQVLKYDATSQKWVPGTASSGTDMTTVWANLAANGNQQINASHLTTALTGYATQTWVGQQGYQTQTAADGRYLKLSGGTLTGKLQVNAVVFGYNYTNSNNAAAFVFDKPGSNNTGIGANGVSDQIYFGACDGGGVWQNYLQKWYFNGSLIANGDITIKNNGRIHQTEETGSILYIGSSNNYGWVRVQDMCSQDGNVGDDYWSIRTSGAAVFTSVYSKTYVTALSDERKKDVVGDVDLTVEQIAKARTVLFRWKDKRDNDLHMGCIAQDWQVLTPQLVHDRNDELSMEYSVIAAIGTVKNSQRLVNHESRLRRLEKMFALNDNDLED